MNTSSTSFHYQDHLLTADECRAWIERTEKIGYAPAPVTTADGPVMKPDVRNNDRVMFDDPEAVKVLWERVRTVLPDAWRSFDYQGKTWTPSGLNERLRFYRYDPGQIFAIHRDGHFARSDSERSFLTLLIYLNTPASGGATNILGGESVRIDALEGRLLLFRHRLLHEGTAVETGRKYVLRSDVMYSTTDRGHR